MFKVPARSKIEQLLELPLPFAEHYQGQDVKMNIVPSGDVSSHFLRSVVKVAGGNEVKVTSDKFSCTLNILSFKPKNVLTFF